MPLVAPKIVGNISILSSKLRIRNHLPGATITVFADGVALSPTFTAVGGGDEIFDFGARPFLAAREISVRQQVGADISISGPTTRVQNAPTSVPLGAAFANVDRVICATVIAITGGVPGTTVRVESRVGISGTWSLKGSSEIMDSVWTAVPLTTAIVLQEQFRLTFTAPVPGYTSAIVPGSVAFPLAKSTKAPVIVPDVRSCQGSIYVENCVVGSTLQVYRNGAAAGSVQNKYVQLWLGFNGGPLAAGEKVEVRQSFPSCQPNTPVSSGELTVVAGPLLPPVLLGPICAGAQAVKVSGLVKGAFVRIWAGGAVWAEGVAATESDDLNIPALPASTDIWVTQGLCSPVAWSNSSNVVTTAATSGALPVPVLANPIYQCGGAVRVDNLEIGSTIKVYSSQLKGEIGAVLGVRAASVDVAVAPSLINGDKIYAIATGCSASPARTATPDAIVQPAPPIPSPAFAERPEQLTNYVKLKGLLPGANVEVLVNGAPVALERVGSATATIEFDYLLNQDSNVEARQSLCDLTLYGSVSAVALPFAAWRVVKSNAEILAVHAALLPTGQVLYFGGSQHNWRAAPAKTFDATRLYDPVTNTITPLASPGFDLFCCGHAMMADGRLLVAGGTDKTPKETPNGVYTGIANAAAFDWATSAWQPMPPMNLARWYPTLLTLADGRVLAAGDANKWEVYAPATNTWTVLPYVPNSQTYYPRLASMPGAKVLSLSDSQAPFLLNLTTNAKTSLPDHPSGMDYRQGINFGMVVLPYSSASPGPEILTVGYDRTWGDTIRPSAATPTWVKTSALGDAKRTDCCTTLLPDGSLLLTGGTKIQGTINDQTDTNVSATLLAEVYDPVARSWTAHETALVVRRYHSCTVLLFDGRVLSLGSNLNPNHHNDNPPASPAPYNQPNGGPDYHGVQGDPATDASEYRIESFRPPYLRRGHRPQMTAGPPILTRGASFGVATPDASRITRARLMRMGSFTHAFGADQRSIQLDIVARAPGLLYFAGPPSADYAPPGYYLLFLQSSSGAVSTGAPVRVP